MFEITALVPLNDDTHDVDLTNRFFRTRTEAEAQAAAWRAEGRYVKIWEHHDLD